MIHITYYTVYKKRALYGRFKGFSGVILTDSDYTRFWVYTPSLEGSPLVRSDVVLQFNVT
jgi:hypothetical protein